MRWILFLIVAGACCGAGQGPATQPRTDDATEGERATEAATAAIETARAFTITEPGPAPEVLRLDPKPLLQWSNPVQGSFHGSVFVWTSRGRPEVIASIYKKYVPLPLQLGVEFHSLTTGRATAERDAQPAWYPERGGVDFQPIPGASAAARSPALRLGQMRALAREFAATKTNREGVTRGLRLLTQPIFRDQGTHPEVVDGALFAFVEGTDPELILRIEARKQGNEVTWRYALARMNSIALRVTHGGREIWAVPTIPWQQAFNPREPYTLLIYRQAEDGEFERRLPPAPKP